MLAMRFASSNGAVIGDMPRSCYSNQSHCHWAAFPEKIFKGTAVSVLAARVAAAMCNDPPHTPA